MSVVTKSRKEVHTSDFELGQPGDLSARADQPFVRPDTATIRRIDGVDTELSPDYLAELAFLEEPVTVMFQPPTHEFGAQFVDCFVQGKGIEAMLNDKWYETKQVPVNIPVVVKRKYLGVLAGAKEMRVRAEYDEVPGKDPINHLRRSFILKHPFSVIKDTEKGHEWLRNLLAQQ